MPCFISRFSGSKYSFSGSQEPNAAHSRSLCCMYIYLDELFDVNLARGICAYILERGTDFVVIVAVASLLAGLLDFLLVEIAILIQVNLTVRGR